MHIDKIPQLGKLWVTSTSLQLKLVSSLILAGVFKDFQNTIPIVQFLKRLVLASNKIVLAKINPTMVS